MKKTAAGLSWFRKLTAVILLVGLTAGVSLLSGCSTTGTDVGAVTDGDQAKGSLYASRTGMVFGYVKDASTGARIAGAQVTMGGVKANTDTNGSFSLSGVPYGQLTITVSAASFQTVAKTVGIYSKSVYLGAISVKRGTVNPNPAPAPTPNPTPSPAPVPSPVPAPVGLTANEQQMVDLVNKERTSRGLKALTVDMGMVSVARAHSQEMIDKKYFNHTSPVTGSPFDRLKAAGISYMYAGENIAGNQSVAAAHTSLMNSEGHKANILNKNYTHIGIGIKPGGPYGMMFTQLFIGK